jgi:hypothetical protein
LLFKAYIHKLKGRETHSRSHKDLNTTDDNMGLPEASSLQLSCIMHMSEFKTFVFEISSDFKKLILFLPCLALTKLGKSHNKFANKLDLLYMRICKTTND